jgi:excinuclease UvrABC nuclease subunit
LLEPRLPGAAPYLGKTADLRRRLERLLRLRVGPSKSVNLREFTGFVRYRLAGSAFEQTFVLYHTARHVFPQRYRDFLRLRRPVLLKVNLRNPYPRCYVTRRLAADSGFYFGPFASRKAADHFASEFLDLFKIRRCQIKIRRDPAFPGCIYSEMKMCLAPCFAGCSAEEYAAEVGKVIGFLSSRGQQCVRELEAARDSASATLDFERASAIHKKLAKLASLLRGLPDVIQPLHALQAVIVQRAAMENTVALFPVLRGEFLPPIFLDFSALKNEPRPAEQILRERFADLPALPAATAANSEAGHFAAAEKAVSLSQLAENLALLARWYYSKPREGEIVFAAGDWPCRRVLRACSRVLKQQRVAERSHPRPRQAGSA